MGTWKSKNRHKYLLQYPIIFVCKYRKKLLVSQQISDDIKQFSYEIGQTYSVIIRYMETDKDHIHYMIETEPTMSISKIVNLRKSYTTYHIWERYPNYLRKHFWKEHTFWTDGYFACSVGNVSEEMLKRYIENQGERKVVQSVLKAYKFRIYPNHEQKVQIAKTFGCCRFVYNQTLAYRKERYEKEKKSESKTDGNNDCNRELKKEYEWLKEVDKFALTNAIYHMDAAYQKFFKEHGGYPKFKSKQDNYKSYTTNVTNGNITVDFESNKVKLPKLKGVKAKLHRKFTGQIKSSTSSQVPSGKYYVSILAETEHIPMECTGCMIGIDLGMKDLLITSDGEKIDNIRTTKKYEDKLAKEQRKLSHKVKGSKNWNKQRMKVAKIHEKIHNTRRDDLHKISHKLISENQVIVSEDLAVSNMVKNHHLAKAMSDCGWYELTQQISYKSVWSNRRYIKIGRFTKSSQPCNVCGYINTETKELSVREWTCAKCGTVHDRGRNAAINLLKEGLRLLNEAV